MNANDIIKASNYIVRLSCENTHSGNYVVGVDEVASAIGVSIEEIFDHREEIMDEMWERDEVLDVYFENNLGGAFDGVYALAYCPNYDWDNDEEVFGCTYEEWMNIPAEPIIDKPLH